MSPFDPDAYAENVPVPTVRPVGVVAEVTPPVPAGFNPDVYAENITVVKPGDIPPTDISKWSQDTAPFFVASKKFAPFGSEMLGSVMDFTTKYGARANPTLRYTAAEARKDSYAPIEGLSDAENEMRRSTLESVQGAMLSNNIGMGAGKEELAMARRIAENPSLASWSLDDIKKAEDIAYYSRLIPEGPFAAAAARELKVRNAKDGIEAQPGWRQNIEGAAQSVNDIAWLISKTGEMTGIMGSGWADGVAITNEAVARSIAEKDEISVFNAQGMLEKTFHAVRFVAELAALKAVSPSKLPGLLKNTPPLVQRLAGGALGGAELFAKHAGVSALLHGASPEEAIVAAGEGAVTGAAYNLLGAIPTKFKVLSLPAAGYAIKELVRLKGGSEAEQTSAVLQFAVFETLGLWRTARMKFGIGKTGKKYQRIRAQAQEIINKKPEYYKQNGITADGIAGTVVAYDTAIKNGLSKEYVKGHLAARKLLGVGEKATKVQVADAWYKAINKAMAGGQPDDISRVNDAGNLLFNGGNLPVGDPSIEPHMQSIVMRRAAAAKVRADKKARLAQLVSRKGLAKWLTGKRTVPPGDVKLLDIVSTMTKEQVESEIRGLDAMARTRQWENARDQVLEQRDALRQGKAPVRKVALSTPKKKDGAASNASKAKGHWLARKSSGLIDAKGHVTPEYKDLAESITGVRSMADMNQVQADAFIKAIQARKSGPAPLLAVAGKAATRSGDATLASARKAGTNVSKLTTSEARKLVTSSGKYAAELSDYIDHGVAPPVEPEARKVYLRNLNEIGRTIKKRADKDPGYSRGGRRTKNVINWARSSRDALAGAEEATGQSFARPVRDMGDARAIAEVKVIDRMNSLLKKATGHGLSFYALFPMDDAGMNSYLYETNVVARKVKFDALPVTSQQAVKAIESILANESAWSVRKVRFQSWYDSFLSSGSATDGKPPDVKKGDAAGVLLAGAKALKAGTFNEWVKTQKWGTRDLYYMTQYDPSELLKDMFGSVKDTPGLTASEKVRPIKDYTPAAAKTRKGEGAPKQGISVANAVMNHWRAMETAAETWDIRKGLSASASKARLSTADTRRLQAFVHSAMGGTREASDLTKVVGKVNNAWWRAYLVSNAPWFATRNLLQTVAFGPSQLNVAEYGVAVKRALSPKTRAPGMDKFRTDFFRTRLSQTEAMHQLYLSAGGPEGSQQTVGGKARTVGNFALNISDYVARGAMYSDQINRLNAALPAYQMAHDAVSQYKQGKIGFNKLSRKLLLDTLPASQHLELQRTIDSGNIQKAASEYARIKVDNIHFRYETSGRSAIEQTRGNRLAAGVLTYFRGTWEIVHRDGMKTIVRGFNNDSPRQVYQGTRSLMSVVAGTIAAKAAVTAVTGKAAYDLVKMLSGHNALAPGAARLVEFSDSVTKAIQKDENRDWTNPKSYLSLGEDLTEIGINTGAVFVPFAEASIRLYEKENDVRRVKAYKLALKKVSASLGVQSGVRFSHTSRDTMQGIRHFLFREEYKKPTVSGKRDTNLSVDNLFDDLER